MYNKKPRITDQMNSDQLFSVIQEAERRLGKYSGDLLAERRNCVEEARIALISWERNGYRKNSIAQDSLDKALQKLLDSGETDIIR